VSVKIRAADLHDLDAALALERACYQAPQAYGAEEYRYALGRAKAVNLLAEDERGVAGFVGAFHHAIWRAGHVYTVNVHPSRRGTGLGRALMQACEDELRKLGMTRVVLEVNVDNVEAIRLYERGGYTRVRRLPDYYTTYANNDAWLYEKPL
jgi:ribosomal protein S18 acetylase RimI-like enzyme